MTPKDLAEKIYVLMFGNIAMDATPEVLNGIESLLSSALEEAIHDKAEIDAWIRAKLSVKDFELKEASRQAYLAAAKLAHDVCGGCDENDDCCPASTHRAEEILRQKAAEVK